MALLKPTQRLFASSSRRMMRCTTTRSSWRTHASARVTSATNLGAQIRKDFPNLNQDENKHHIVYLDSAATSQKPLKVIEALDQYYRHHNSNVHKPTTTLSEQATSDYEGARKKAAKLINAATEKEIVFTRNATEAINIVAHSWGMENLKPGDEIVLSVAEHHSNLAPWQLIAKRTGAVLKHVKLTDDTQEIDMQHLHKLVTPRTKIITLPHVSNMLGAVLDVEAVVAAAKKVGARVMLDSCQSVPHMPIDVQGFGVDWIVASGHKMMAPTGIGFLWGRYELLDAMPPWMVGGETTEDIQLDDAKYTSPPLKFEAGTPSIADTVGLGAAIDYINEIGMDNIHDYEREIGRYLYDKLSKLEKVTIYGPPPNVKTGRAALMCFNFAHMPAKEVSKQLDAAGIALRAGDHRTQPLHKYLGIESSVRASCYAYNTFEDVDLFIDTLQKIHG